MINKTITTLNITWAKMLGVLALVLLVMLPPTVTAYAAYRQGQDLAVNLEKVHVLTNSNLSAVQTDLEIANREIKHLKKLVADLVAERTEQQKQGK